MSDTPDDTPPPEKKAEKSTTNITGRVPLELKKAFGDMAISLGSNESRAITALAKWFIEHKRFPADEAPEARPPLPHPERLEHVIRRELAAAIVVISRIVGAGKPVTVETATQAVREFFITGKLQEEVGRGDG